MSDTALWLVGFRYHVAPDRTVHCFYVVDNARDRQQARRIAADLAATSAERGRRNDIVLDQGWAELRCLHRDFLGRWDLEPAEAVLSY
ncbi:hypothetical protein SRB17_80100 [Streptomyces sp. RB17]|uniref:hypothetical protein n=1 Tax=Streptomyces sp. RB17 TaxID=2585197 RepID=UPI001294E1D2|nr:hypothetical protein [Streptomyces sp. RB17]MQY39981.1 hypothetical protein [Streptomyces sp. RB17]